MMKRKRPKMEGMAAKMSAKSASQPSKGIGGVVPSALLYRQKAAKQALRGESYGVV